MADIHILTGDGNGGWQVAFHFPVPDTNNLVNVPYRTALVNSGLGGSTSMTEGTGPGQIAPAEMGQIAAGARYEQVKGFARGKLESGGTSPGELRATLRLFYGQEKAAQLALMQAKLAYFGHTESEV